MSKRVASKILLFIAITVIITTMHNHFCVKTEVQAATPGLNKTALYLYEGHTDTLMVKNISGTVQWKSSNSSVAKVSTKGKVTAKKKGTTVVTATVGGKKYKCKVIVDKIVLNYQEVMLKPKKKINLSMIDSNKKVVYSSGKVKWTSSDSSVASVDKTGSVYAQAAGTATITGTVNDGTKATCKVQVEGLRFINIPEYINVGETIKLDYIYVYPPNKKDELIWTIEYDTGEAKPVVPYSFDRDKNTLTALSEARLVLVTLEAKSDCNIGDFCGVEILDSPEDWIVSDEEDDYYQEVDNTTDYYDDFIDDQDTMIKDNQTPSIDYDYLAATRKPTLRTSERFIIDEDCSVTIYDGPILYLPTENWDIWEKFYYTVDGTTPTENSTRFRSTIYLEQSCTLKMIGVSGDISSPVLTINFNLLCNFAKFWGTNPVVDSETVAYAIKNNVSDLSVLNEKELELYYKTKQILEEIISPGMTDYDKLKAIHDYICRTVTYGSSPNDQDPYGALILNKCVCTGYAESFKLLAGLCDIHTIKINGIAGGSHMWNLVKLEGDWYHVDCDSDDIDAEDRIQYRFFLVNDAHFPYYFFKEFTSGGRTYTVPAANGEKYNTNTVDRPMQLY